jgi:hypothetical protein
VALGCSVRYPNPDRCYITIATDDIIRKTLLNYEIILRHEVAHCNGWPQNHPDGRRPTAADWKKKTIAEDPEMGWFCEVIPHSLKFYKAKGGAKDKRDAVCE